MKTMNNITKTIFILLGISLCFNMQLSSAFADYEETGVQFNYCRVLDPSEGVDGRASITLRDALAYANESSTIDQRCRKSITIEASTINLEKPLEISVKNTSAASVYVIRGAEGGNVGLPVKLDFAKLKASQNSDPAKNCAIHFKGTHDILLKDISIENIPAGYSAVCVENQVNNITFDNVRIAQVNGGHGIVFFEDANANTILPGSIIEHVNDSRYFAIKILGSGLQSFNQMIATDRSVVGTDSNGLSISEELPPDVAEKKIKMFSIGGDSEGQFISSDKPIQIRMTSVERQGSSTLFRVEGDVVDTSTVTEVCSAPRVQAPVDVARFQIYAVQPGTDGEFYKYLMPRSSESGGNGLDTSGLTQGRFRFLIDRTEAETDMIVLVPELTEHSIGPASKIVKLLDEGGVDCPGKTSGGGMSQGGALAQDVMWSKAQCEQERRDGEGNLQPKALDCEVDSDSDGLSDCHEDSNGNCTFDQQDFSDWMDPDSDDDGVIDSVEARGLTPINVFNDTDTTNDELDRENTIFCKEDDATSNVCNVNKDSDSNARDDDADSDGLLDYQEDRQRTLNPWKSTVITTPDGIEKPCSLGVNDIKGIHWGVYRWKPGQDFDPIKDKHDFKTWGFQPIPEGTSLVPLACKRKALTSTDFNGVVDGNETDPYNIDSDDDDFCDGEGPGCNPSFIFPNPLDPNQGNKGTDNCPRTPNDENACALECNLKEDLYRVGARNLDLAIDYLVFDLNDPEEPQRLADKNINGVSDLFEIADWKQLYFICDDLDGDNIPDCVERMNPDCLAITQSKAALDPHRKDSDNDGAADNIDADPFDGEVKEVTDGNRDFLRTALRKAQVNLLKCFVDRDKDGLTDCEEDINRDDSFKATSADLVAFLADPSAIESDPLLEHTDSDGVSDKTEHEIQTNPQSRDTDGDGLSDRLEVKGEVRDSYDIYSGAGCAIFVPIPSSEDLVAYGNNSKDIPSLRLGTNPTNPDTDGDGIPDGVEARGNRNGEISLDELTAGLLQGFDLVSNPLSLDSDGDGLNDLAEYGTDGVMSHIESNPCDSNTDNDSRSLDSEEPKGCATNPDATCVANENGLLDSDTDGLPDSIEAKLGTNPNLKDTDGDDIRDGDEDISHDGIIQLSQGETDPRVSDTDLDGLDDGQELKLGTFANKADTDSDCILDGVEVNFNEFSSFTGTDTNPTSPDSDGDGLCDGNNAQTNGGLAGDISCIRGEDVNCNGKVDPDPKNPDRFAETDPRNPDTDSDGLPDKTEVCAGGRCDLAANIGHATLGAPSGCFSLAPVAPLGSSSMLYVYGLLLIVNRMMVRKKRHSVRSKCHPERSEGSR